MPIYGLKSKYLNWVVVMLVDKQQMLDNVSETRLSIDVQRMTATGWWEVIEASRLVMQPNQNGRITCYCGLKDTSDSA